jgi:hypothetical protein
MRVDLFAIRTKVRGAKGAAIPLSDNPLHVPVAKSNGMRKVLKIG